MDDSKRVLDDAREAWDFHEKGLGWLKWVAVGEGLLECRRIAFARALVNDLSSPRAKATMGDVLREERLDRIDAGDRSILLNCMANLPAITKWRETLSTKQRVAWNHPRSVWSHFQKAGAEPAPSKQGASLKAAQAALAGAEAKITALEQRLRNEGSLFNLQTDTAKQIGRVLAGSLSDHKAEAICKETMAVVKERRARRSHAG